MIPREAHAPKYILGRNKIACQNNFGSKIYFGKPSQTPSVTLLTLQTHSNTFQTHFKQQTETGLTYSRLDLSQLDMS